MSTDLENILSRFFGFGRAAAAPLGRTVCIVCGNTGVWGAALALGVDIFSFIAKRIA